MSVSSVESGSLHPCRMPNHAVDTIRSPGKREQHRNVKRLGFSHRSYVQSVTA
jgi:hypothetical protein